MTLPPWDRALRTWQHAGVEWWARTLPERTLTVATPGGGKTLYAAAISYGALASNLVGTVVFVVPSDHLRTQVALSLASVGVQLDPYFSNSSRHVARGLHGIVVTYQQVALAPELFDRIVGGPPGHPHSALVVLDEIHHAGDDATWGKALQRAFQRARHIVTMSGTPFRSDNSAVCFVDYDNDGCVVADTVYSYADGLRDGVVRPLVFMRQGGDIKWTVDGEQRQATFGEKLTPDRERELLRAALRDERWVSEVLRRAQDTLNGLRRDHRDAGGLVVAVNERHARWIAKIIARVTGRFPVVVVHTDVEASQKIAAFADGNEPWLVAVRMVTEGVDIPRLRVIAYLTTVLTEMFFRQMAGRAVRADGSWPLRASYVLFPDHSTLREWAKIIETDVLSARRLDPRLLLDVDVVDDAQAAAVSSSAPAPASEALERQFEVIEAKHVELGEMVGAASAAAIARPGAPPKIQVVRVPTPTTVPAQPRPPAPPPSGAARREKPKLHADEQRDLKNAVNRLARQVAARFHRDPKEVYGVLRRRDGVSMSNASDDQLQRRRRAMETWLREGLYPR